MLQFSMCFAKFAYYSGKKNYKQTTFFDLCNLYFLGKMDLQQTDFAKHVENWWKFVQLWPWCKRTKNKQIFFSANYILPLFAQNLSLHSWILWKYCSYRPAKSKCCNLACVLQNLLIAVVKKITNKPPFLTCAIYTFWGKWTCNKQILQNTWKTDENLYNFPLVQKDL